jgi:hypothetical protein
MVQARRIFVLALSVFVSIGTDLGATENAATRKPVAWKTLGPWLDAATAQRWEVRELPDGAKPRSFDFSAIRFHLGHYRIQLVSMLDFATLKARDIAQDQQLASDLPALFELGVRAVFRIKLFREPVVAVAPAGFPTSSRLFTNLGLLKIDGVEKSKLFVKGPSVILCLDNPPSPNYQYQVPTFFRTGIAEQRNRVTRCGNAVQVGPRILDDPTPTKQQEFAADPDEYRVEMYKQVIAGKPRNVPTFWLWTRSKLVRPLIPGPYSRLTSLVVLPGTKRPERLHEMLTLS